MRNSAVYALIWRLVWLRPSRLAHIPCVWPEDRERLYGGDMARRRSSREDRLVRWCEIQLFFDRLTPEEQRHIAKAAKQAEDYPNMTDYVLNANGFPRGMAPRLARKVRRWKKALENGDGC
jgi:hypothetical protein